MCEMLLQGRSMLFISPLPHSEVGVAEEEEERRARPQSAVRDRT